MRISDWSSDVCSSDLPDIVALGIIEDDTLGHRHRRLPVAAHDVEGGAEIDDLHPARLDDEGITLAVHDMEHRFARIQPGKARVILVDFHHREIGSASLTERVCPYV